MLTLAAVVTAPTVAPLALPAREAADLLTQRLGLLDQALFGLAVTAETSEPAEGWFEALRPVADLAADLRTESRRLSKLLAAS